MPKTVGLVSLGCPKNLVDSEIMLGLLEKAGYKIVSDPSKAAIIIVNTCSFIEDAKRESIETVLEMAKYKDGKKSKYLIVAGCLPQRYKDELANLFPEVDLFIGTGEYHQVVKLLSRFKNKTGAPRHCGTEALKIGVPEYIHTSKTPRKLATPKHAAYIKIAEGCFHGCSFCTIPRVRGRYRSRPQEDIIREVKSLMRGGAKELNLIAQDTTAYGRDLSGGNDIVSLLDGIAQISGEKWIRLFYTYPQSFKRGIIRVMKKEREICRYIDLPIQHIDDGVLFNMKRGRSEKKIRGLIDYIKTEIPEIALRTTVIVGFPGETEGQFSKLLKFVEEGWFDHLGVFTYSEEEGTAAAGMKNHIPEKIKEERQRAILGEQKRVSRKRLKKMVGKKLKVLVGGVSAETEHLLQARSEFQAPDIDGVVYINDGLVKPGCFYNVEITGSYDYDLLGRVI